MGEMDHMWIIHQPLNHRSGWSHEKWPLHSAEVARKDHQRFADGEKKGEHREKDRWLLTKPLVKSGAQNGPLFVTHQSSKPHKQEMNPCACCS